ncbi:MAG: GNAT family N-acetyltransferase [Akkermansiaceae bacterium]|nr:GNAT family N-acetyltransferase [Akkermansiaceae bacterium]
MEALGREKDIWRRIVRPGSRVFIGSGAAVPRELVKRMLAATEDLIDVELVHIHTLGEVPWVAERYSGALRTNAFFLSPEVGEAVLAGRADYTPVGMSEVPRLFRSTMLPVDVAMVMVSPPDALGRVSLGVSVDVVKAAVEAARVVVAEINPRMPVTAGDGWVPLEKIDWFIEKDSPLAVMPRVKGDAVREKIGEYLAELVEDGSTLQVGLGATPQVAVAALKGHRHLGIHSGMFCDGLMDLIRCGAVDHSRKHFMAGKAVVSHAVGTRKLYEFIRECRELEFRSSDWVNDPGVIAMNHRMVAVNGARQIDLTGQVMRDATGHRFHGGIGAQLDFLRGAAGSEGGRPVHVLTSTTEDGRESRIVAVPPEGAMVATGRTDTDYVITEHGVARLRGKSVRERALEMIQIADPRFREDLLREAHGRGWVPRFVSLVPTAVEDGGGRYGLEFRRLLLDKGRRGFFMRPLHASDVRRLQEFFYSHSEETVRNRYGYLRESMPADSAYRLVGVDQTKDLALGIFEERGLGREPVLRAVGRFYRDAEGNRAEVAFVVHEETRRMGMAGELLGELARVAKRRGIRSFWASVLADNAPMKALFERMGGRGKREDGEMIYEIPVAPLISRKKGVKAQKAGPTKSKVAVGWHWSALCLEHDGGPGEVENPRRYAVLGEALRKEAVRMGAVEIEGRMATRAELLRCHGAHYLDIVHMDVERLADRLRTGDTAICPESERVAKWATGSALAAVEAVMEERVKRAFVAVRPPGHHATADRGMGFCIYNHVALMARHAQERFGVGRVLIVDWDVHHGNGTQDLFFSDAGVFYFSVHEDGIFPFTGAVEETGAGPGLGTTMNVPLPHGTGGAEVLRVFEDRLVPAMEKFRPELVLISAGFDALATDPLGGFRLTPEDFVELTRVVVRIAEKWAEGRVVSVLEGGYDPDGLAAAAVAHLRALS